MSPQTNKISSLLTASPPFQSWENITIHKTSDMVNSIVFVYLLVVFVVESKLDEISEYHATEVNALPCPDGQTCIFLELCPRILQLMSHKEIPIHRFRQNICDYDEAKPKVCCDLTSNAPKYPANCNPTVIERDSYSGCGKCLVRSNVNTIGIYPFVARIGFINTMTREIKYPCSGSIVNERTILTTASCALGSTDKYKLNSVLIGEFNTATDPDCNSLFCAHASQTYNISYVVKYPTYDAETFRNNIALLRLHARINFTVAAQPICIAPKDFLRKINNDAVLVGWGRFSQQAAKPPIQQWLPMKILSTTDCNYFITNGYSVEMCAIGPQEPCSGYSGSPLIYRTSEGYFLIGILSYGASCNKFSNLPTVFTNIPKYAIWIQENS